MKHHEQHARFAFDEQRAIEDLQKLHREIQRVRNDRQRAEGEFDEFMRRIRAGETAPPPPSTASAGPPTESESAPDAIELADPAPRGPEIGAPDPEAPVIPGQPKEVRRRTAPRLANAAALVPLIVAAVAVLILVLVFATRTRPTVPVPADSPAVSSPAVTSSPPVPSTPPAASVHRPTQPARAVSLELLTSRPVWVRVIVDGRTVIERELGGGQKIPLQGDTSVVVRAGDAGAVRIVRNGRDEGVLGGAGQVVTRRWGAAAPGPSGQSRQVPPNPEPPGAV